MAYQLPDLAYAFDAHEAERPRALVDADATDHLLVMMQLRGSWAKAGVAARPVTRATKANLRMIDSII